MLRISLFAILLITAGCGGSEPIAPESRAPESTAGDLAAGSHTFVIVPEESSAAYMVDEEFFGLALSKYGISAGFGKAIGRTQSIEGQFELNPDDIAASPGENTFTIRMNTFTSDRPSRDQFLREDGPRFNDYPVGAFLTTEVRTSDVSLRQAGDTSFDLDGQLTVREITRPVTFRVSARLAGNTLTGVATAQLRMTDFGFDPPSFANTLTASNEFDIEVRFTARTQEP